MPPREPRIISAEEARALREGRESFGAWDAGAGNIYAGHDTCPRHKAPGDGGDLTARCECRAIGAVDRDGDRNLAAAAPDLAATVEHLHARAERAERAATDVDRMMSIVLGTVLDGSEDTPNCNEFRGTYKGREFAMIVQWANGKSPHALLAEARADRDAALAHAEELTRALRIADRTHDATLAERDALRAIIEGRTTPPTDAEIEAHDAAGGWWLFLPGRGFGRCSCSACRTAQMPAGELLPGNVRMVAAVGGGRWWALDAQRRPCAWPVVTEAP